MEGDNTKCRTCIGIYEYRTAIPCRYCMYNEMKYWSRMENEMIENNYHEVKPNPNDDNIPF